MNYFSQDLTDQQMSKINLKNSACLAKASPAEAKISPTLPELVMMSRNLLLK